MELAAPVEGRVAPDLAGVEWQAGRKRPARRMNTLLEWVYANVGTTNNGDIIGRHLGFRVRTVNALVRGRGWSADFSEVIEGLFPVTTMTQLAACGTRDVLRLRGAGRKTLADCGRVLRAHGYTSSNSRLIAELESVDGD